jgi:GT2 family glycosyltransferase
MAHTKKETITIGWCDAGMVEGRFADGIINTIMTCDKQNINFVNKLRVNGNQIGRQRQVLFDKWADDIKSDWLLWVDSDIVLTPTVFKTIWETADKLSKPVVTGVYFVSKENEQSLMQPFPAIFNQGSNEHELLIIHPLPDNQVIKVDSAGFGLTLMHKSIIDPIRAVEPDYSLFGEKEGLGNKYISEDIVFFRKLKKAGIPLYAHTGATVQHLKTFSFDQNYYNLYWNGLQKELFTKG